MNSLHERVAHVMGKIQSLPHDTTVPTGGGRKYQATSGDAFYEALRPLLAEAQVSPHVSIRPGKVFDAQDETKPTSLLLLADCWLSSPEGREDNQSSVLVVQVSRPQDLGAAETYITRHFLRRRFLVSTGENEETHLAEQGGQNHAQGKQKSTPKQQADGKDKEVESPAQMRDKALAAIAEADTVARCQELEQWWDGRVKARGDLSAVDEAVQAAITDRITLLETGEVAYL